MMYLHKIVNIYAFYITVYWINLYLKELNKLEYQEHFQNIVMQKNAFWVVQYIQTCPTAFGVCVCGGAVEAGGKK